MTPPSLPPTGQPTPQPPLNSLTAPLLNQSPSNGLRAPGPANIANRWNAATYAAITAVAVLATAVLTGLGTREFIGYDSIWHVFIARQDSWASFWREVFDNAHPPLYYFLLGIDIKLLGESLLAYRVVSIAAILVSTLLIARIVLAITSNPWLAVAAGAAFGLSANAVEIGLEVRAYALCLSLLLAAFLGYIDWLGTHPARLRTSKRVVFSAAMTAAVLTNYSACFFLAAAVSVPPVLFFCHRRWRLRLAMEAVRHRGSAAWMFGVPLLTSAVAYGVHVRRWANRLNHVPGFMYDPSSESVPDFIARTTHDLMLLAFPKTEIGFGGTITVALLLLAAAVGLAFRRGVRGHLSIIPFVVLPAMLLLNLLAGLAGRYPYGGPLRHEIFLFPFAIVALFVLLERVRREVPLPWSSNRLWVALIGLGVAISCASWMTNYRVASKALMQEQMDKFRSTFIAPPAILVDQFNFIIFFGHHHDWNWHLAWQGPKKKGVGVWQIWEVSKPGQSFRVCRSRKWQLDFSQPDAYADISECLSQADRVAVFRPQQHGFLPTWETKAAPRLAHEMGRTAGLSPDTILVDGNDVYISFRPADGGSSGQSITVLEATYGKNCDAASGNATRLVRDACDGQHACTFQVDAGEIGDPVPGCEKDFRVAWACGENPSRHQLSIAAEAGFGSVAILTCDP